MNKICKLLLPLLVAGAALAQPPLSDSDVIKLAKAGLSDDFILNVISQQKSALSSDVSSLIEMKTAGVNERILTAITQKSPPPEPLNSDSVIRLVKAGFSDTFIADLLKAQPGKFSLTASRIVELREAGVSERILSEMVSQGGERTLPAGAEITVRLIDSIDSQRDSAGQNFHASLDQPIMIGNDVIAPKGAEATVRLAEDKDAGKFSGKAALTVELISIQVNHRAVPVTTSSVTEFSNSRTARTAKSAAIVGALGAIIGGIAGGGQGAAIGAGAGAAAGAGGQAVMKGPSVKIPSETLLTFTTRDPVKLP